MPRQALNNSSTATDHSDDRSPLGAVSGHAPAFSRQMTRVALAAVVVILFASTLTLKPATMAGFPTLGSLSADACGDLFDDGPKPPDMPILLPSVEQPRLVLSGTTVAALDRQPLLRPRLVSFPALPQGPPART